MLGVISTPVNTYILESSLLYVGNIGFLFTHMSQGKYSTIKKSAQIDGQHVILFDFKMISQYGILLPAGSEE